MKGPHVMLGRDLKGVGDRICICVYSVIANCEGSTCHAGKDLKGVGDENGTCVYSVMANCEGSTCHAGKGRYCYGIRWSSSLALSGSSH